MRSPYRREWPKKKTKHLLFVILQLLPKWQEYDRYFHPRSGYWQKRRAPGRSVPSRVYPSHLDVAVRSSQSARHPQSRSGCTTGDAQAFLQLQDLCSTKKGQKPGNPPARGTGGSATEKELAKWTHRDLRAVEKLSIRFRGCVWKPQMHNWYGYAVWVQDTGWIQHTLLMMKRVFFWKWCSHFWCIFKIVYAIGKKPTNPITSLLCFVLLYLSVKIQPSWVLILLISPPSSVIKQNNPLWVNACKTVMRTEVKEQEIYVWPLILKMLAQTSSL